ncbi:MAG: glycosyltransferase family 4 protein [Planctomycetes bacterium]|nr:glycosyltransferase family 4 protein [Planctomycetota bacterium]
MRILLVSHRFLPAHAAGTEVYTGSLALALAARGHEVHVLTAEKDVAREDLSVVRRTWSGIPVVELTNNLFHRTFRETWDQPQIARAFAGELERVRPDLVHVQHLMYLSIGCVEEAARRRLPVVFTLHDFWLQCPRFGQLVHADGALCSTVDFARCGTCLCSFKFRQSALERNAARALAGFKRTLGIDLAAAARSTARAVGSARVRAGEGAAPVDPDQARAFCSEAAERDAGLRSRLVPNVRRFVSPSRFLRDRMVAWGIAPAAIEVVPTGLELERFRTVARTRRAGHGANPLRVAFLGTLAPHKGAHVALAAWELLPSALRSLARLEVRGPIAGSPEYHDDLLAAAARVGAEVGPPVARDEVPRFLSELDLLLVPSTWYENAPLVILEARAARTPLLVSALGGMAELVAPGVHGEHFRAGEAADLARVARAMLEDRERLSRYYAEAPPERDTREHVDELESIYRALQLPAPPSA